MAVSFLPTVVWADALEHDTSACSAATDASNDVAQAESCTTAASDWAKRGDAVFDKRHFSALFIEAEMLVRVADADLRLHKESKAREQLGAAERVLGRCIGTREIDLREHCTKLRTVVRNTVRMLDH